MRVLITLLSISCCLSAVAVSPAATGKVVSTALSPSSNDLTYSALANVWDAGVPLGNAIIGALVWQKGDNLRMSLDHVGLWDLRTMVNCDSLSAYPFKWIEEQVLKKDVKPVQMRYDRPYDTTACPSKIPGGALEFAIKELGSVNSVRLYLNNALCEVKWDGGASLQTFVHAVSNEGWFRFANVPEDFKPVLVPPEYQLNGQQNATANVPRRSIARLGYPQGAVTEKGTTTVYHQPCSNGFWYEIAVTYKREGSTLVGVWTVRTKKEKGVGYRDFAADKGGTAAKWTQRAIKQGFDFSFMMHNAWWQNFWTQSSVTVPDAVLAKQYYNEMYKFGSAARSYSPPISLQAVWTADNGLLPPWKGDYHHDLNTELSYWPCYTGNHLEEGEGYLNWLWETMPANRRYTKEFFGFDEGLAVPGVATLQGEPMGGWVQYAMQPTTVAWLSHHFYLHWLYSADREFLKQRAYPYIREAAVFLDKLAVRDEDGKRKLPLSVSPEIYDNTLKSWFLTTTNYDLALIRFLYSAAEKCARELGLNDEAAHWQTILSEWTDFDLDNDGSLTFAKGCTYSFSHRHLSNAMAFHPLGLLDRSNSEADARIVEATVNRIEKIGARGWCGYSYSWFGNMKARNFDGEGAAKYLRIFAEHFCTPNTFHANGDQTRQGYSGFSSRDFTLEGNFAFASGIQEMLIQSHTGVVRLFPAIPAEWKDVSFSQLRTVGAFLVSAEMKNGAVVRIVIKSEKGGTLRIAKPANNALKCKRTVKEDNGLWVIDTIIGEVVEFEV